MAVEPARARVFFGADHGGVELKDELVRFATQLGADVHDLGTHGTDSVDYPDFGEAVARAVLRDSSALGVVCCGSGIGISIAANKVRGIRCALCHDSLTARLARRHNNANMIAFGGRITGAEVCKDALQVFLKTPFEGGRHARRVARLMAIEEDAVPRPE